MSTSEPPLLNGDHRISVPRKLSTLSPGVIYKHKYVSNTGEKETQEENNQLGILKFKDPSLKEKIPTEYHLFTPLLCGKTTASPTDLSPGFWGDLLSKFIKKNYYSRSNTGNNKEKKSHISLHQPVFLSPAFSRSSPVLVLRSSHFLEL